MEPLLSGALDHVGVAANPGPHPLDQLLAGPPGVPTRMPSGVEVARTAGVELVRPAAPGSPVERFLERRGPGLHHLALRIAEPLEDAVARLGARGIGVVGAIEPGSDGRRTVFLDPRTVGGVLIELVEEAR